MQFNEEGILAVLDAADQAAIDAADFGIIAMTSEGVVDAYNRCESELSGLSAARVVGQNFFTGVAPCTNNFMVAQRFLDEPTLDVVIDYVFTLKMRPTKVKLRMLKSPSARRQYLLVRRALGPPARTENAAMSDSDDLQQENERLLEFLYLVPVGLAQTNLLGDIALMNSSGVQYLMPLTDAATLDNLFDVLDPYAPELRNVVRLHTETTGTICEGRRIDVRALGRTGGPAHIAIGLVKIDSARVMAVIQDVTRTVEHERALFADQQRFRAIYDGMRDAMICTVDRGERINSWNASGERLYGYTLSDVSGRPLDFLMADGAQAAQSRGEERSDAALLAEAERSGWTELQGWGVRKDGTRFWAEGVLSTLYDESGALEGYAVVMRDMTERKLAIDKLHQLATTDALTGLANRRTFCDQAEKEIARKARYKAPLCVLMVDADRFKSINDEHGHAAGDEVLRHLATMLKTSVRSMDVAARYGGEEFVVLLPETTAAGAMLLAERVRTSIASASVEVGGATLRYTVSIGAAEAADGGDLKALLSAADRALYRAKEEGRNRVTLADPGPTSG